MNVERKTTVDQMTQFDIVAFRKAMLDDEMIQNIWNNKYRWKRPDGTSDEASIEDSKRRVVNAICGKEPVAVFNEIDYVVRNNYFLPAGRQNAGAGTGRRVTLQNCYAGGIIQDSMPGIQYGISQNAFTLQQGGGIGDDFSPVRPAGAIVRRTGSVASGSLAFMNQRSAMSDTVCSAGERRGAMMTTLADWHADLWNPDQFAMHKNYTGDDEFTTPSFISIKRQKGKLTQTNISVLISDAFMKAVENDDMWDLGHWVPRADGNHVEIHPRAFPYDEIERDNHFNVIEPIGRGRYCKGDPVPFYVYRRVPARQIWHDLMQSTYKYAEPGVIFIDRINKRNNLFYCEDIQTTNPCGEQPLPPHGTCCLGSINLAFMVGDPFTDHAYIEWGIFKRAVHAGVRFLDNVLDISAYPLDEQYAESMAKRRIGLGRTGIADLLLQMQVRYGSPDACNIMRTIARELQIESYRASMELAKERGPFPKFDRVRFMESPNVSNLPDELQEDIYTYGIRNGVLNTEAPNGTIAIYAGNVGGGIEPIPSFNVVRKVRQPDSTLIEFPVYNYAHKLYIELHKDDVIDPRDTARLPDYFADAMGFENHPAITPAEHIVMQAACQEFTDASMSKTVNCPPDMSFEDFRAVYEHAYETGCKGCTTYRPDPDSGRGSVLTAQVADELEEALIGAGFGAALEAEGGMNHDRILPEADLRDIPSPMPTEELHRLFTNAISNAVAGSQFTGQQGEIYPVTVKPAKDIVEARRYKLKWPQDGRNWYITITRDEHNEPFEVFITTSGCEYSEWVEAMARLLTAIFRRGGDLTFLLNVLGDVASPRGGASIPSQQRFRPSVVAAIGGVLEQEFAALGITRHADPVVIVTTDTPAMGESCPACGLAPLIHEQACKRCVSCGWSNCE